MIWGAKLDDGANFTGQREPYYEFDALLAAARRAYDSCRYVLWNRFGPSGANIKRSLKEALPFCTKLDPAVHGDLQHSWDTCGSLLTSYRDCIQHYVPIDPAFLSVTLQQELPGIWTAWARIPDNPDDRSKNRFTFKKQLDALTYGWETANEALRVLEVVIDAALRAEHSSA